MVEDMETNPSAHCELFYVEMQCMTCPIHHKCHKLNTFGHPQCTRREYLNHVPSILASHVKCEQFLIRFIYQLHRAIWTQIAIQAQILDQYPSTRRVYIWHICFIKLGDSLRATSHTRLRSRVSPISCSHVSLITKECYNLDFDVLQSCEKIKRVKL